MRLARVVRNRTTGVLHVIDEPSIGLYPANIKGLTGVMHDLDVIRNADYIIDMGPGGGIDGGKIIAVGTPEEVSDNKDSVTGRFIRLQDND